MFEPFPLRNTTAASVAADDPDLHSALRILGLTMTESPDRSAPLAN
jgi:hypothetical protein